MLFLEYLIFLILTIFISKFKLTTKTPKSLKKNNSKDLRNLRINPKKEVKIENTKGFTKMLVLYRKR